MDFTKIQEALKGSKTFVVIIGLALVEFLGENGTFDGLQVETYSQYLYYAGGATLAAKFNRFATALAATPPPVE